MRRGEQSGREEEKEKREEGAGQIGLDGYGWMVDFDSGNPTDLRRKYWKEERAVPVFAHGVKLHGTHEVLKYWKIGKSNSVVYYWNWYTGTLDWKTDTESDFATTIFPLCLPQSNFGELPKKFKICVNETG